ncbi:MAG: N-acetylglucosamine-6-phosphate deacetylase [Spirochaetia bacterium]|nr:N-acetylglucosamine-6-phosphate deacetylase [Spirochaetia bacterium]
MIHRDNDYAIIHAKVMIDKKLLEDVTIVVNQGIIMSVGDYDSSKVQHLRKYDAKGSFVGPGLIDMHIHGCGGFDSTKGNIQENLECLALFLEERGITSFQLAIVYDLDVLIQIKQALIESSFLGNYLIGVHIEGPFIAPEKKGGILPSCILGYERSYLDNIIAVKRGKRSLVTTMTIAPELPGSEELTSLLEENNIVVAYGHSNCLLEQLKPREKNHITHLFNAMSSIDHKNPGIAAMPFVRDFYHSTYELICDGVHVNPSMIDFTFTTLGTGRICLISDAMNLAGMGPTEGFYLGKKIYSDGRACYYSNNNVLIGSSTLISESAKMLFQDGFLDWDSYFQVTSENPLRVLSQTDKGFVKPGYKADLVVFSDNMDIIDVFKVE